MSIYHHNMIFLTDTNKKHKLNELFTYKGFFKDFWATRVVAKCLDMGGDSISNIAEPSMGGLAGVVGNPCQEDLAGLVLSALRGVTGFKNRLFLSVRCLEPSILLEYWRFGSVFYHPHSVPPGWFGSILILVQFSKFM